MNENSIKSSKFNTKSQKICWKIPNTRKTFQVKILRKKFGNYALYKITFKTVNLIISRPLSKNFNLKQNLTCRNYGISVAN